MKFILLISLCLLITLLSHGQDSSLHQTFFQFDQNSQVSYLLEYRTDDRDELKAQYDSPKHYHAPARITVTVYRGNNQIELATITGVYASSFCDPIEQTKDNPATWVRLAQLEYLKPKK